jgi:hypothetical protein
VLKVESQAEISLGQTGLSVTATLYICFQFRALIPTGIWLVDPTLKISVNGVEISERGRRIVGSNRVDDIVRKFRELRSCLQTISRRKMGHCRNCSKST